MKILILEDEQAAAERLRQIVESVEPAAVVTGVLESIRQAVSWFEKNEQPDIILSDIQLADGLSLEIFRQVKNTAPIIFTTAYDDYTLKAFKLNSIDYLLKPIDVNELKAAFEKYRSLRVVETDLQRTMLELLKDFTAKVSYKTRFLVRQGDRLITIPAEDVAYIQADDKVVFLFTKSSRKYIIDQTLDDLESVMDPKLFFRINRTYIAPLSSIEKIHNHFSGRLKIMLGLSDDNDIFVSRARAAAFKEWLNR